MKTCVSLALILFFAFPLPAEEKPAPNKEQQALIEALTKFYQGLASAIKEERTAALKAMLPEKKDIVTLFPEHAEKLWTMFELAHTEIVAHVDEVSAETTRNGALKSIEVIDMRNDDEYAKVKELIPKGIPIYRAIRTTEKGTGGSSSYIFINEKWRWIRGLEIMPEVIAKLPK